MHFLYSITSSCFLFPEVDWESLLQGIEYYKEKDGNIGDNPPVDFLDAKEQKVLISPDGKFRVSLYKVLLFSAIAAVSGLVH